MSCPVDSGLWFRRKSPETDFTCRGDALRPQVMKRWGVSGGQGVAVYVSLHENTEVAELTGL